MGKYSIRNIYNPVCFYFQFYLGEDIQTTRFTICLVLYEDETESLLNFKVPLTGAPFIYHIYKDPLATRECRYFRRVALSGAVMHAVQEEVERCSFVCVTTQVTRAVLMLVWPFGGIVQKHIRKRLI